MAFDVVIPSAGRASLRVLLDALAAQGVPAAAERVVVVDDGGRGIEAPGGVTVVPGAGRGPAAARNAGRRACAAEWTAFLDDDVIPEPGWLAALEADLAAAGPRVGGSQGRISVPLPAGRRSTDWERNVAGLEAAQWATADLAYRRAALDAAGGFDERFPRAYREDSDAALRVRAAGWTIERGTRGVLHPVGPADARVSLRKQAGNADDALMDALHGPGWRERAGAPPGRRTRHLAVAAAGVAALVLPGRARRLAAGAWAAGTAELAWARIAPGPRTPREVATMAWTSAAMPFAATGWWLVGRWRARGRGR